MSAAIHLCVFLAVGLLAVSAQDDPVTAKIKAKSAKYVEFAHNHNIDGILGLYASDAILMPQGHSTVVQGKTYARTHLSWINNVKTMTLDTKEVKPLTSCSGNEYVFQRSETTAVNAQDQVTFKGKNLIIWRKVNDDYEIYTHMYNKDQ